MAQTQESVYPDAPPSSPVGAEKPRPVGASRNRRIKGAPARLGEAFELADSDAVRRLLQIAGWMAVSHAGDHPSVDGRDLFVASLKAAEDTPYGSALTWLYDSIKQNGGGEALANNLARWVPRGFDHRDLSAVPLTKRARAILARARIIAEKTANRNLYGARHIIAALTLPDSNECNDDVFRFARVEFGANLSGFHDDLFALVKKYEVDESLEAWEEIRREPPPSPLSVLTLAGFTSDSVATGGGDPLGIAPDVRAFARLICLEQAKPPLFGEWGSGKSSFMERLQVEIEEVVKSEKKRSEENDSRPNTALRFVENLVQIRFNAWHYADANLWASLTAVFFDQLRWGGAVGGAARRLSRLDRQGGAARAQPGGWRGSCRKIGR